MTLLARTSSRTPVLLLTKNVRVKLVAVAQTAVLCVVGDSATETVGCGPTLTGVVLLAEPVQLPVPAAAERVTLNPDGQVSPVRLQLMLTSEPEGTARQERSSQGSGTGTQSLGELRNRCARSGMYECRGSNSVRAASGVRSCTHPAPRTHAAGSSFSLVLWPVIPRERHKPTPVLTIVCGCSCAACDQGAGVCDRKVEWERASTAGDRVAQQCAIGSGAHACC